MSYINRFTIIHTMMERKPFDSKMVLADVKREAVIRALERSKAGLPRSVTFTNEPMEETHFAKIPHHDKERLCAIYDRITETPHKVIPELVNLQRRYPDVPVIYNYLGIAYRSNGQEASYVKILHDTVERFPAYLFGKTSLADYYLNQQQHHKVKEVFEGKFELWQHYPLVKMFHLSEVRSFFCVVGSYFARRNNLARALYHYSILADFVPDHPATTRLGDEIVLKEIENVRRKITQNIRTT